MNDLYYNNKICKVDEYKDLIKHLKIILLQKKFIQIQIY